MGPYLGLGYPKSLGPIDPLGAEPPTINAMVCGGAAALPL